LSENNKVSTAHAVDDGDDGAYRVRPMTDRAALAYLEASGATAISIVDGEAGCTFRTGAMAAEVSAGVRVPATFWVSGSVATAIARRARKLAGDSPDVATATQALAQAAADYRVTLTPHATAMARARSAAARIDSQLDAMMSGGGLRVFNAEYKRRREAAGGKFMSYKAAQMRLRQAIVPHLIEGRSINRSLFEQIFGR
jgi:hypothetical protein